MRSTDFIEIDLPNGDFGWLGQVSSANYSLFGLLMDKLLLMQQNFFGAYDYFSDSHVQRLCIRLADLCPLIDRQQTLSVEHYFQTLDHPVSESQLTLLFWGSDALIYRVNYLEPEVEEEKPDPEGPVQPPMPSSGFAEADIMAVLITIDGVTLDGALQLMNEASLPWLTKLVEQIKEVRRDPEDRLKEYKGKSMAYTLEKAKQEDLGRYHQLRGLRSFDELDGPEEGN